MYKWQWKQNCKIIYFWWDIRKKIGNVVDLMSWNIIFLSPGGAPAHSYQQPKEAGSSALLRPWQNPGQQPSKHHWLWAWGHEPARWVPKTREHKDHSVVFPTLSLCFTLHVQEKSIERFVPVGIKKNSNNTDCISTVHKMLEKYSSCWVIVDVLLYFLYFFDKETSVENWWFASFDQ